MVSKDEQLVNTVKHSRSEISFNVHYPENNPINGKQDITDTLAYLGVFDGVNNADK